MPTADICEMTACVSLLCTYVWLWISRLYSPVYSCPVPCDNCGINGRRYTKILH